MSTSCLTTVRALPEVVARGQCMGCGFCAIELAPLPTKVAANGLPLVDCRYLEAVEHWGPVVAQEAAPDAAAETRVCPGISMDMPALAREVFGREPKDPMLGEALRIAAGYAADTTIRREAASGGITTALLARLLREKSIGVAYCTAGRSPEAGGGILARSLDDLTLTTGSHYHPVAFGRNLGALVEGAETFAFVGLPCEIAAMRRLMAERPDVAKRCIIMIGLFCGGINRFSGIGRYLRRFGIDPQQVDSIDYRHGAWPGQIAVGLRGESGFRFAPRIRGNSRLNILHYMISFQGYAMLPRCRICPDQISDFADIAVGDPHLPRFKKQDGPGYSAVIARTERGRMILDQAEKGGVIVLGPLSRDEVVESQGYTLENRRHTLVYVDMARRLGFEPPQVDVYADLKQPISTHQHVYAFVDLAKIRARRLRWLQPLYLPLQVFEYLFLTLSPRLILGRLMKLLSNR